MTGEEDDLAGLLPPQPPPAPAKREAAIGEAMRRFDGGGARTPAPPRRSLRSRPQLAGLAIASLVMVVGLPVAWFALDRDEFRAASGLDRSRIDWPSAPASTDRAEAPAVAPAPEQTKVPAKAVAPPTARVALPPPAPGKVPARKDKSPPPPPPSPPPPPPPAVVAPAPAVAGAAAPREESRGFSLSRSVAAPIAPIAKSVAAVRNQASVASVGDAGVARGRVALDESADVVVTGTRVKRGDARGPAAKPDGSLAQMPKSARALLERGLARAEAGDSVGALADLDQAARLAPRSARVHFERGRLLRAQGDERRAKAEFARAAELDSALGDPGD